MIFDPKFFQKISIKKEQIDALLNGAKRSLELASSSEESEIVLHFCYSAVIKLGIAAIGGKGYKVRSIPGHHIKILEAIAELRNLDPEIKYINNIRKKRNLDLYEGTISLSNKEAAELIVITKKIFQSMQNPKKSKGFTLVELLVSVGIASVIMVGMSTFFSSTFRNMFEARDKVASQQAQFVMNTILQAKFLDVREIEGSTSNTCGTDCVLLQNETDAGNLPFTYLGADNGKMVFKDFFVFNGQAGPVDSSSTGLANAGGITRIGPNYFVNFPQENMLRICRPIGTCAELVLPESIDHPIDITSDGTDLLFITDAGNGRIISVDLANGNTVNTVISGLDFPAGLQFYNDGVDDYLFFTEPYKNTVSRVRIDGSGLRVVVGAGSDETCSNTASFCELNFPTGLVIGDDGSGEALYIADTGNGRILRVSEPTIDLSDVTLTYELESDSQLSRINFTLPVGADASGFLEGASGNTLRPGITTKIETNLNVASYVYEVATDAIYTVVDDCPGTCVNMFRSFRTANEDAIFTNSDTIEINGINDSILSILGTIVTLDNLHAIIPTVGDLVRVATEYSSGSYDFNVDLSGVVSLSGGFQSILVEAFDENDLLLTGDTTILRLPDGTLGSSEDVISVVSSGHDYVTGLGWNGVSLISATEADYSIPSDRFDYVTDFEVRNLDFEIKNLNRLLEFNFEALLTDNTIDGSEFWADHSLNANLTP